MPSLTSGKVSFFIMCLFGHASLSLAADCAKILVAGVAVPKIALELMSEASEMPASYTEASLAYYNEITTRRWTRRDLGLPEKEFTFNAYSKTVLGRPRLVIILGELHAKNKASFEIGCQITSQFKLRGCEGLTVSPSGEIQGMRSGSQETIDAKRFNQLAEGNGLLADYGREKLQMQLIMGRDESGSNIMAMRLHVDLKGVKRKNTITIGLEEGFRPDLDVEERLRSRRPDALTMIKFDGHRDYYMAQRTHQVWEANPRHNLIIVGVGQRHVEGIGSHLERAGYEEVELPQP